MEDIEVSVIVPSYNNENSIERCLSSIIDQNFSSFEIIFINDGSTDNTLKIANKLLTFSKIKHEIINQKNLGVSSARNNGLKIAKGKYICFVDADDYISENHLKKLHDSIIHTNSDFSFTKMMKVDEKGNYLMKGNEYKNILGISQMSSCEFLKLELLMKIPFSFSQIMYNHEILKNNEIIFNENEVYGEDTEFFLKASVHGNFALVDEFSYFYTQSTTSTTSNLSIERFNFVNILEKVSDYYSLLNLEELSNLIITSRIPKSIFGNLMYLFFINYPYDDLIRYMNKLNLFSKLSKFKMESLNDFKFYIKIKFFLLSPKIYHTCWKKFKNSIF
ncbi:glycosyltransferase family 2 protein [Methanobrevibacter curvatus]|uniref:glycosyltransferase family 2 protein n=1 Tax=Methanobrevibacter curvatus TaxID=49547 RepID=UPI0008329746|nr:glycosyltransferase family 2 protein [Methanobrevibacter curvatus]